MQMPQKVVLLSDNKDDNKIFHWREEWRERPFGFAFPLPEQFPSYATET